MLYSKEVTYLAYKVKEVADWAGISVRTLHHYDAIGLLKPKTTTSSGYRLYDDESLRTLQQILFFRELGFNLTDIAGIVRSPGFDPQAALAAHRELLLAKRSRIDAMIAAVDQSMAALRGETTLSKNDLFASFHNDELEQKRRQYQNEVQTRWGSTNAYRESQQKTAAYTKDDWKQIMDRAGEIFAALADLTSQAPDAPEVQAIIARWHRWINDHFYACDLPMFQNLALMYTADPRFAENIDAYGSGLALFMQKAMNYYCDAQR